MKHRVLGRLGWSVSEIGFCSWALGSNWGPRSDRDSVVKPTRVSTVIAGIRNAWQAERNCAVGSWSR